MLEPIIDETILVEDDRFQADRVNDFLVNPEARSDDPSRHYSQAVVVFDKDRLEIALAKLNIPLSSRTLIFGGYTGQFAASLRAIGMNIIFTDPMIEWAAKAYSSGYESYKLSAEEIPGSLIERSQLVATFECYIPFSNEFTFPYNALRFLTTEHGILFSESSRTREQMAQESGSRRLKQMKSAFTPYKKVYGVDVRYVEAGDVRLYRFKAEGERSRRLIKQDCRVIKSLYDHVPGNTTIDKGTIEQISVMTGFSTKQVSSSVDRFFHLHRSSLIAYGAVAHYFPADEFLLFSKKYKVYDELI